MIHVWIKRSKVSFGCKLLPETVVNLLCNKEKVWSWSPAEQIREPREKNKQQGLKTTSPTSLPSLFVISENNTTPSLFQLLASQYDMILGQRWWQKVSMIPVKGCVKGAEVEVLGHSRKYESQTVCVAVFSLFMLLTLYCKVWIHGLCLPFFGLSGCHLCPIFSK